MADELNNIYDSPEFDSQSIKMGNISEQDKFDAAKKILFGLAILYVLTLSAYLIKPEQGEKLLEIASTILPPLATLILAQYFRDNKD